MPSVAGRVFDVAGDASHLLETACLQLGRAVDNCHRLRQHLLDLAGSRTFPRIAGRDRNVRLARPAP